MHKRDLSKSAYLIQAHCSVEKAARVAFVNLRILDVDEEFVLRGNVLAEAIKDDLAEGMIPFFVRICTLRYKENQHLNYISGVMHARNNIGLLV